MTVLLALGGFMVQMQRILQASINNYIFGENI